MGDMQIHINRIHTENASVLPEPVRCALEDHKENLIALYSSICAANDDVAFLEKHAVQILTMYQEELIKALTSSIR